MHSSAQQKILLSSFPLQVFSPEVEDLLFCSAYTWKQVLGLGFEPHQLYPAC